MDSLLPYFLSNFIFMSASEFASKFTPEPSRQQRWTVLEPVHE
jgi:hypothetical protein